MGLPEKFSRLPWTDAARAETNLGLLRESLPEELLGLLPTVLRQVPDPDAALNNLERFARGAGSRVLEGLRRSPVLLHYLLAFFSYSRYLTETLMFQPELILWIEREKFLARLKTREDLLEELARFEATALDSGPALTLARFKRREYLRIALKDILDVAVLTETTHELSVLADVLVEKALRLAGKELERRHGWPHASDERGRPVRSRFAVVSLGKLGGGELNYSSDIDLLFLYDGEGVTPGGESGRELAASEYFLRLGQRVMQLIGGLTPEGAVFRVDMRLRPGGGEGDLVISLSAALAYYRESAHEWELQMLLKARVSAGDELLVREFLAGVEPFLYRDEMDFAAVESVFNARDQMDRKLRQRKEECVDVKLSPGGIRDIEFLVQCLQRLYGRHDRWVRSAGTLLGLQRLADKGYLSPRDHHQLASAYQFLRLVEHRLQLDQGQQIHQVPTDPEALGLLARRCRSATHLLGEEGSGSVTEDFSQQLQAHRDAVQEVYARVLPRTRQSLEAEPFRLVPAPDVPAPQGLEFAPLLGELRKRSEALYQNVQELEIPGPARKMFHRFLAAVLASSDGVEALEQAPEVLPRAVELLVRSEPLGEQLIRRPEQVHQLQAAQGQEGKGPALPFPAEPEEVAGKLSPGVEGAVSLAEKMALLRTGFQQRVFRWGVESLWSTQPVQDSLRRYSDLARQAVREAWNIAAIETGQDVSEVTPVALGRLGMRELDYGADLDLVFLAASQDARLTARPLVEKFIQVLSAYTQEGTLFQVDSRLRPEGKEGELVATADGALEYFRSRAQLWEAAAYLKAVPVLGDDLGREWRVALQEILAERFSAWEEICQSLLSMRQRLETEAAAANGEENFKTGAGGLYDIDFILSGLALRSGATDIGGLSLEEQGENLQAKKVLGEKDEGVLQKAVRFYRTVDHAIRLVTGKNSCALPTGLRAPVVARLAGQWLSEDLTPATLETRLAETRQGVRQVFNRVFRT